MLVKHFSGSSGAEALARVREQLGENACILETRRNAGGIEILAAAERPGPRFVRDAAAQRCGGDQDAERLRDDLLALGFSLPFAEQIASAALANLDREQLENRIAALVYTRELVSQWLAADDPAAARGRATRAVVGAPGVGKTTTIAKLAAAEAYAGREVLLASADTRRLGGAEQLESYARVLGVPFVAVRERRDLDRARERGGRSGLLLIDTPGVPRTDTGALDQLAEVLGGVRREEIELLLPADHEIEWLADTVRRFAKLRPGAVSVTRADEAVRPGSLITALARCGLPLRSVGFGPDVPDDLVAADPRRLAAWALPLPGQAPQSFREIQR